MKDEHVFAPAAGGGAQAELGPPAAGVPGGSTPRTRDDPATAGPEAAQPMSLGESAAGAWSRSAKSTETRVSDFVPALLNPEAAVPDGLVDSDGRAAGKRFDVYRNNVVVSLSEALAVGFPVIEKLVGAEFFAAMAGVFVRAHPPRSPVLTMYGDTFPVFLETFPPVAHLPYLADTARLEYALREAYHAADAAPVSPERLQDPRLLEARLTLAPATRLVVAPYPIHAIWRANTEAGAPPASGGPQAVLVTRPDWDPKPVVVPPAAARFVAQLLGGANFQAALEAAGETLDLAAVLTQLIDTKSITRIEVPE